MPRTRRLILVGGGHAHVEVLRDAARTPFGGELVLVSPYPEQLYTGLLPGQLRGAVDYAALRIDLRALCANANARFVEAFADRIDAGRDGVVVHTRGEPVTGDLCSLDVGSIASGLDVPGVREFAYTVRPQAKWRALVALVNEVMRAAADAPFSCCVVGGGAAGVELALAIVARAQSVGQAVHATLVEAGDDILEEMGPIAAARVRAILRARGVRIVTQQAVVAVAADHVLLADGTRIESALTVWATGPAAPPLLRRSGLPVDDDGFLRVDASLRAVTGIPVYGAGDCVALEESSGATRSGVQAVHAAPVLARNLRAVLQIPPAEPTLHESRTNVFALLDTADGKAFLYWRGMHSHSTWALRFKRWKDERFLARYRTMIGTR